jgi:nitrogen fixation protein FixH
MMRKLLALVLAASVLLVACGEGAAPSWRAASASYQVQLTLDAVAQGSRQIQIDVSDRSGRPVEAAAITIAPTMSAMGHTQPELTAVAQGSGSYTASGELFSMLGAWELAVVVRYGDGVETVSFPFDVNR